MSNACVVRCCVVALSRITYSDALAAVVQTGRVASTVLRTAGSFAIYEPIGLASLAIFGYRVPSFMARLLTLTAVLVGVSCITCFHVFPIASPMRV